MAARISPARASDLFVLGRRAVVFGARDDVVFQKALHAIEIRARQIALRLGRGELRPLLTRVELDEHFALPHGLAGIERDAIDGARTNRR